MQRFEPWLLLWIVFTHGFVDTATTGYAYLTDRFYELEGNPVVLVIVSEMGFIGWLSINTIAIIGITYVWHLNRDLTDRRVTLIRQLMLVFFALTGLLLIMPNILFL